MERMGDLLAVSILKRWNVVPVTRDQTVGEHAFRVAVIAREIAQRILPYLPPIKMERILSWSIDHDGPECLTGDLPSNLKRHLENRGIDLHELECDLCPWFEAASGQLTVHEEAIIGIADSIEAAAYLQVYGAPGTLAITDELKRKAHARCKEAAHLSGMENMVAVGMEVAEEVWKGGMPILLEEGRARSANKGT